MAHLAVEDLQKFLNNYRFEDSIKILEAGCGSFSHIVIPRETHIVGIDISEEQLQKNDRLDEKINGDIERYELPASEYDLIISWDVLEHLEHPKLALDNFKDAIRQRGLIILAMPNVNSLKGLITKFTPHWFHVFVYKYILNKQDAGLPGCAPFPTFLKYDVSPGAITRYAKENGFEVVFMRMYDALPQIIREKKRYLLYFYFALAYCLKLLTLGAFGGKGNTDYICVLCKLPV